MTPYMQTDILRSTDGLIVKKEQNVQPILDYTHARRMMGRDANRSKDKTFYHVAEIPMVLAEKWISEGINIFTKEGMAEVMKKLNDPDLKYFRVWDGRI